MLVSIILSQKSYLHYLLEPNQSSKAFKETVYSVISVSLCRQYNGNDTDALFVHVTLEEITTLRPCYSTPLAASFSGDNNTDWLVIKDRKRTFFHLFILGGSGI